MSFAARSQSREEVAGSRVEEDEPGEVRRPDGIGEHLRVERTAERVRGEDVQATVLRERRGTGHRVEDALDARPDLLRGPATRACGRRARRSCEVEQMRPLRLVELKPTGERLQHGLRDALEVPALEAGVVVDADAGEHRDLLAAQPGNATGATEDRQARLLRRDPGPPRGQELADLAPVVHDHDGTAPERPPEGSCQYPVSTGTPTHRLIRGLVCP